MDLERDSVYFESDITITLDFTSKKVLIFRFSWRHPSVSPKSLNRGIFEMFLATFQLMLS